MSSQLSSSGETRFQSFLLFCIYLLLVIDNGLSGMHQSHVTAALATLCCLRRGCRRRGETRHCRCSGSTIGSVKAWLAYINRTSRLRRPTSLFLVAVVVVCRDTFSVVSLLCIYLRLVIDKGLPGMHKSHVTAALATFCLSPAWLSPEGETRHCRYFRNAMGSVKSWLAYICLLYTSPSPRDRTRSRMPSSA